MDQILFSGGELFITPFSGAYYAQWLFVQRLVTFQLKQYPIKKRSLVAQKKRQQAMYAEHEIRRHRRISIEYRLACGRLNLLRVRLHLFLLVIFRFLARLGKATRRTHN